MLLFFVSDAVFREEADHLVQQLAQSHQVDGGNRERIAQTQIVELVNRVVHADVINLVDNQNDRLAALAQHDGDFLVVGSHACAPIRKEEDDVAGFDGDFRLTAHLLEHDVVGFGFDTAGIDQGELVVEPFAVRVDAVAGYAGRILDNGDALLGDLVKESRFADVRSADDGNKRFCHVIPPFRAGHRADPHHRQGRG